MSIDTMTPGGGRGRGCGRGAPFGNTEQRRELRSASLIIHVEFDTKFL